jgi:predicted nucleotidyltransferase
MDIFNDDFRDFILALNKNNVKYVLVGGYSVIIYGYRRATGDMDILVEHSEENYNRLVSAFKDFGMPIFDMTLDSFLIGENDVYTFGRPPVAIDILTKMKGVSFIDAYNESTDVDVEGLTVRVIHINHLILAKKASGRHKDLDDLENLPVPV